MRPIPDPVHESQGEVVENVFGQMVFNQHKRTADPDRFAQQDGGILRVVQDIHEKRYVKGCFPKRELLAVECLAWDLAPGPHQEFHALYRYVGSQLRDETPDRSVTAADILDGSALRVFRGQQLRKHSRASLKFKRMMPAANPR